MPRSSSAVGATLLPWRSDNRALALLILPLILAIAAIAAAELRTFDLACERLALHLLELRFLVGGQHAHDLFIGRFVDFLTLFVSFLIASKSARFFLRLGPNLTNLVLLLFTDIERFGDFFIAESASAHLLQRNLLGALELLWLEDLGDSIIVGFGQFPHLRLPFFLAQIAQSLKRFALLFRKLFDLLDLLVGQLQFLLDRFLGEKKHHAATETAAALSLPLSLLLRLRQAERHREDAERHTDLRESLHRCTFPVTHLYNQ